MNDKFLVALISVAGGKGYDAVICCDGNASVNVGICAFIGKNAFKICGTAFGVLVFADCENVVVADKVCGKDSVRQGSVGQIDVYGSVRVKEFAVLIAVKLTEHTPVIHVVAVNNGVEIGKIGVVVVLHEDACGGKLLTVNVVI